MAILQRIAASARSRLAQASDQIDNTLQRVAENNPLGAEKDAERLIARLQAKAALTHDEATVMARGIEALTRIDMPEGGEERVYGSTIDFVGSVFLDRGAVACRAVARVAFRDGRAQGSGFLVSPRLFLTNNHVIGGAAAAASFCAEFDYELDRNDRQRDASRFAFDPSAFFETDARDDLDFTLIAIGDRLSGPKRLSAFGWCPLSGASDKHALGEFANIVQHPDGRLKEVVLRENRLVSRLDTVLHYVADTEPGSSGSPVFNNEWRVIALHHWGGPWRQKADDAGRPVPREVNEGIRISAIVGDLGRRAPRLPAARRILLDAALQAGEAVEEPGVPPLPPAPDEAPTARLSADGSITWRLPIEISVRLPGLMPPAPVAAPPVIAPDPARDTILAGERMARPNPDYSGRPGYKPKFIAGHVIDLPVLSAGLARAAAPVLDPESGDDAFELKYNHFSIAMHKQRRLAIYTACNIDGARAKHINRETGAVSPLAADDPRLESLADAEESEGAEATEAWTVDPRIDPAQQTEQSLYEAQDVPGHPDRRTAARMARMFQRGHLIRRLDPAWGADSTALKAEADTFHFTNCAPQLGFFNQGTAARLRLPKSGGGKLWRAVENHVLRNAVAEDKRINVYTGPVFDTKDPVWRQGLKVPLRFWKVVVWEARGRLCSLAMIADQGPVIDTLQGLPEAAWEAEAFDDVAEVADFLSTIAEVQRLTGLAFDAAVGAGDIRRGGARRKVTVMDDVDLSPPARKPARPRTRARPSR